MRRNGEGFFWVSFTDLMTSLFFIMLVLYILTYMLLLKKERKLQDIVEIQKQKLSIIQTVEENIRPLKEDTALFRYEPQYKRFTLAFDVKFLIGHTGINAADMEDYASTIEKIDKAGAKLKATIDNLQKGKLKDGKLANVSYLVIISGYASHLAMGEQVDDYQRSFNRAYGLWDHWKNLGINFEDKQYNGLIDLQISGNGWGGVGRFPSDPENHFASETKNQRFIIQIVPKIGNADIK